MEQYGLFGLFLATFLSSTILPLPSEVIVATFIALHSNAWIVLLIASLGNTIGSLTTYTLGYFGWVKLLQKFSHVDSSRILYFRQKSSQYGGFLAFFSFLPFIGDLFTLALGLAQYNLYKAIVLIALGKTLRYGIVIFATEEIMNKFLPF